MCVFFTAAFSQENAYSSFDVSLNNSIRLNRFLINPSFSYAREIAPTINLVNKRQWVKFEDAPVLYLINYQGRLSNESRFAIGGYSQSIGISKNTGGFLNYALNVPLQKDANFTFGLNAYFSSSNIDINRAITESPEPLFENLSATNIISIKPGINLNFNSFDIGIAADNIISYNLTTSESVQENKSSSFSGHVMYTKELDSYYNLLDGANLSTMVRVKSSNGATGVGGNFLLDQKEMGWVEAGYNTLYGANAGVGVAISNKFLIGYAYNLSINNSLFFGSSHEFSLSYRFDEYDNAFDYRKRAQKIRERNAKKKGAVNTTFAKLEQERIDKAKAERERVAKEKAENDRLAQLERERLAALAQAEKERLAREQAEKDRLAALSQADQAEKDRLAALAQAEKDRQAKEQAERDRLAALAQAEKDRLAREQAEKDRIAKEEAERLRLAKDQAERDRLAKEAAERDRLAREKAEQDRLAREKAEQDRLAREKAEQDRLAREKAEQDRLAREKAEQDRLAREKAEQDRLAREKAEQDRLAREKAEKDRLAREKAEQDRLAREKAEQDRLAREKAEKDRLAKEQAANAKLSVGEKISSIESKLNISNKLLDDYKSDIDERTKKSDQLIKSLDSIVKERDLDLKAYIGESDPNYKGPARKFVSTTQQNAQLNALKSQIAANKRVFDDLIFDFENANRARLNEMKEKGLNNEEAKQLNDYYQNVLDDLKKKKQDYINLEKMADLKIQQINDAKEEEKQRRIKKAQFDSEQQRIEKDQSNLENIKNSASNGQTQGQEVSGNLLDDEPITNDIPIVQKMNNVASGYYMVLGKFKDTKQRDAFIKKVVSEGGTSVNQFYNIYDATYYVFLGKYDELGSATKELSKRGTKSYNKKMKIVQVQ